jgi:hypothetical protein
MTVSRRVCRRLVSNCQGVRTVVPVAALFRPLVTLRGFIEGGGDLRGQSCRDGPPCLDRKASRTYLPNRC